MHDRLFRSAEFRTSAQSTATVMFVCPYGTPIEKVRFAIRRLLRGGNHVVAYETTTAVFGEANPMILPELIRQVREDIRSQIARLTAEGVTDFGFFGSSIGSFILYNCIGDEVPELRWGVFNTGGNIARGLWNYPDLRQLHVAQGWSLPRLEQAWAKLQWPDFGRLDGCRFVFASSRRDSIARCRTSPSTSAHCSGPAPTFACARCQQSAIGRPLSPACGGGRASSGWYGPPDPARSRSRPGRGDWKPDSWT
jgi:hypothetical protein